MGAAPLDVQIQAEILTVEQRIAQARRDLTPYTLNDAPIPIAQLGAYTNLLERRHALELQRTYPNAKVYTQLTFGPVMHPDGHAVPLRGAGKRRPDMGVLDGDTLYLIETKVLRELLDMFPKGSKARNSIEVELKKSSTFGKQWAAESSLRKQALRKGAYIAITGTPVMSRGRVELPLIPTTEVHGSRGQVYRNMGDGLPIKGPGTPAAPVVKRVQTIDLQPSATAIRAAKLNRPLTGTTATTATRPGSTVTPADLRAAKATGGVLIPKLKRTSMPASGVVHDEPVGNRMVDDRGTLKASGTALPETVGAPPPRRTFETAPTKWSKRIGSDTRAVMADAVAQAFHDFMERRMVGAAYDAAQRALERKWFRDKVFAARQSGAWVLVTADFAESIAANAGGTHLLMFQAVNYRTVYARPGEDPEYTLERLRRQRMADQAEPSWRGRDAESGRYVKDGWRTVTQEVALYPGGPTEEVVSEPDPTGLGVGRCTIRKLR